MIRKMFYLMTVAAMVALFSFNAKAQDAQIQRGAGAQCRQATEIKVNPSRYSSSQVHGNAIEVSWKVVRKAANCPIRQLQVTALLQTVKTKHADAETLRLSTTVSPGLEKTFLKIPAHKVVIFSASDARLKITPIVTPVF